MSLLPSLLQFWTEKKGVKKVLAMCPVSNRSMRLVILILFKVELAKPARLRWQAQLKMSITADRSIQMDFSLNAEKKVSVKKSFRNRHIFDNYT